MDSMDQRNSGGVGNFNHNDTNVITSNRIERLASSAREGVRGAVFVNDLKQRNEAAILHDVQLTIIDLKES